jgi:hypothetical protein
MIIRSERSEIAHDAANNMSHAAELSWRRHDYQSPTKGEGGPPKQVRELPSATTVGYLSGPE